MSLELKFYRLRFINNQTSIIPAHTIAEAMDLASEKYDVDELLSIYPIDLKTFL